MDIKSIGSHLNAPIAPSFGLESPGLEPSSGGSSFLSYLEKSMADVNTLLNDADQKATDLAMGKSESLHESMISAEKAETAFKLMVQFRAKAIEAYNEILRMQV